MGHGGADQVTPNEEAALLAATIKGLDDELRDAWQTLLGMLRDGVAPRDAVQEVIRSFAGEFEAILTPAFNAIMSEGVGSASMVEIEVSAVQLSSRMYAGAQDTAKAIDALVDRHAKGFQDAKGLMLEIFEGYGSNEEEVLTLQPSNRAIPQYLRTELLTDNTLAGELRRTFARAQAEKLKTPALRAAYLDLLDAIQNKAGAKVLERKMQTAWNEKMRYFARRIAETELHRVYSKRRAAEIMGDDDVEFVQVRRAGTSSWACICDLITGRDKYGLGPGVYPKQLVPLPPYHPFCRCVLAPRLDFPLGKKWKEDQGADQYFLRSVGLSLSGKIMGSKEKAEAVLKGSDPIKLANVGKPDGYQIKPPV